MTEETRNVKIRIKSGGNEAEVEASLADIRQAIDLIPEILARLPLPSAERRLESVAPQGHGPATQAPEQATPIAQTSAPQSSMPSVTIEKGDSLSDVISKFFADPWGTSPKKLMEVREALQSYGLNYPKQSVAVALLRLAKSSKIRRFKGEGGEYVYTASTGAVRIPAPIQATGVQHHAEEEAPATAMEAEPAEADQLNLDTPSANRVASPPNV
ncbi:MAG: hypothetical protein OK442_08740 [Thaumarchaeota archaeon]|nr:hypothetical protein [Nitrososphaerota archaeon]